MNLIKSCCLFVVFSSFLACTSQVSDVKSVSYTEFAIAFTGDVLLDRGVRQQIQRGGVEDLFASVAPLFHQMDATVINLECPVTSVRSPLHKKYIFHAEPRWMEELVKAGISHAALANNHTMDQGRSGLTDTYQHLLSAGITPIGYGSALAG